MRNRGIDLVFAFGRKTDFGRGAQLSDDIIRRLRQRTAWLNDTFAILAEIDAGQDVIVAENIFTAWPLDHCAERAAATSDHIALAVGLNHIDIAAGRAEADRPGQVRALVAYCGRGTGVGRTGYRAHENNQRNMFTHLGTILHWS